MINLIRRGKSQYFLQLIIIITIRENVFSNVQQLYHTIYVVAHRDVHPVNMGGFPRLNRKFSVLFRLNSSGFVRFRFFPTFPGIFHFMIFVPMRTPTNSAISGNHVILWKYNVTVCGKRFSYIVLASAHYKIKYK